MYGRVVNKHARYNLCVYNEDQEPDYESGCGRIIDRKNLNILNKLFDKINEIFDPSLEVAEMNYYYNIDKCGIGYHGDAERKRVICARIGESIPLKYKWYINGQESKYSKTFTLNDGDIYVMSEKAVGTDWKKKKVWTLRHAAGEKFI